jgi:hypothetical protein
VFVRLEWKKLTNDKHSSLLQKSVIYGQKMFYNIGPRLFKASESKGSFTLATILWQKRKKAIVAILALLSGLHNNELVLAPWAALNQWKRISYKHSTKWQHLSRLKAVPSYLCKKNYSC